MGDYSAKREGPTDHRQFFSRISVSTRRPSGSTAQFGLSRYRVLPPALLAISIPEIFVPARIQGKCKCFVRQHPWLGKVKELSRPAREEPPCPRTDQCRVTVHLSSPSQWQHRIGKVVVIIQNDLHIRHVLVQINLDCVLDFLKTSRLFAIGGPLIDRDKEEVGLSAT